MRSFYKQLKRLTSKHCMTIGLIRPCLLLLIFMPSLVHSPAYAQGINKYQLKTSYIYNFAKNIQWPNENQLQSFDIAVYQAKDKLLLKEISALQGNANLKGKPIRVANENSLQSLVNYQLVYLEEVNSDLIERIYDIIDGKSILLVTADYEDKQFVMINLNSTQDKRILFEVNKANIINQGLSPLPDLILHGGTEIDVAELYKAGQASLIKMQRQLQSREANLKKLTQEIYASEKKNAVLEENLKSLNIEIRQSAAEIAKQNQRIQEQAQLIEENKKERQKLLEEMAIRQRELNKISEDIKEREIKLGALNKTIAKQEEEIVRQSESIVELGELVSAQERALTYLRALVVLGVILVLTILGAYLVKRRDNLRLQQRSEELRIARDKLAIAKEKAEEANQAKSDFLSLMTHELRTPLQAIIGYTDVVMEELNIAGIPEYDQDLKRVISNSERLLKLINGVLDLAKIESGKLELHLSPVFLSSLVEEAVNNIRPQYEKNKNELIIDAEDGIEPAEADREKLLHITLNLLSNAGKFTQDGKIWLKAKHQNNHIYISVKDTGIGLTEEQASRVFDRFKQADSSVTRRYQGTGLGLAITKQLCEFMGGSIRVESQLGVGTTFYVNIPLPITPMVYEDELANL